MKSIVRLFVAGLAVCSTVAFADTPAPAPAAAPATTQSAGKVSPEAAEVLAKVGAAYAKLKSLDLAGQMSGEFDVAGRKDDKKIAFNTSYAAPNQFKHEMKDEAIVGSTGEKLYLFAKQPNAYMTADAPKGKVMSDELPQPFAQLVGTQNVALAMALSKDPAKELTTTYGSISKGADVKVDDKAYIALDCDGAQSAPKSTMLIDPATLLIRRVVMDMAAQILAQGAPDVKKAMLTIDYTTSTPDAPTKPEQFAWTPPAGAKDMAQAQAAQGDDPAKALEGKPAPDFALKDLDDKEVALKDLKGSVVVLDFWATWCGPCVKSLPEIDKLYQEKKEAGLKVFAVNQGEDREKVQGFIKSKNLVLPVLLDSDSKVGNTYLANAIPQTVVIGKDGKVLKVFVGAGPTTEKDLHKAVDEALKAK